MSKQCVVVHAGARDQYQLALAMAENNYLKRLVTELYCPDALTSILPSLAKKRYQPGVSSNLVSISIGALITNGRMYLKKNFTLNNTKDYQLSKKAYNVSKASESHLFCYSYYATYAFSQERAFPNQKKLLFQLHPHPFSVKKILEEELTTVPAAKASILYENEFQYSQSYLDQLGSEPTLADAVVVASNYTKQTLIENGVKAAQIKVVPYGINNALFKKRTSAPNNKKLRVLFVGSMVQRKGLSYLFDALKLLKSDHIELVLCGRGFMDEALLKEYSNINFSIKRNLSATALVNEFWASDVFVFPSLSEGFAHVILEAMSCGLPAIATDHSCAPDIITHDKDGWVIPVKNSRSLAEQLSWCISNKEKLFEIGQAAAITANNYSWEKFRRGVAEFYESAIM